LSSAEVDLCSPAAVDQLAGILRKDDALVFASCITPDKSKDIHATIRNLLMGEHVCAALQRSGCAHVVYLSSDAVYADSESLVRENSRCEPSTLYGLGHLTRERMVRVTAEACKIPWLIARPTLVYGKGDTHNSYGPNRFLRQIADVGVVKLFGNGEEQRDHVHIDDVTDLLALCLQRRSTGVVNLATGTSTSFGEVARRCIAGCGQEARIEHLPRSGPITHRQFDVANLIKAFPAWRFTTLSMGLPGVSAKSATAA
jgi:nucleoside-diphosphate-sugar epimerase